LVALKLLRPEAWLERGQRERLLREARTAAAVNHPNIAAIYEVGEADGVAFIAMEYVDGKPLRSLMEKLLPEADALELAVEIARGLARAHAARIVHRDLKPENLLIDRDGHVKILDFGVAKPLEPTACQDVHSKAKYPAGREAAGGDSLLFGTPWYMSPEQSRGGRVDARSDIYSFGVLLYELVCGRPSAISGPQTTASRAAGDLVAQPSRLANAPVSPALKRIIQRCLHEERSGRYANGGELLAALLELRRKNTSVARWVALGALGLLGIGAASWMWWYPSNLPSKVLPSSLGERRLTANPPENMVKDAALAPDGSALAYVDQSGVALRRIDPPSTEQLRLPEGLLPNAVSWYPDSESLFVSAWTRSRSASSLWKLNTRSGAAEPLSEGPLWAAPTVSPDGEALAWVYDLHEIHWKRFSEATDHTVLVTTGDDLLLNLAWSPSDRRLAYVRVSSANTAPRPSLETIDLYGQGARVLLKDQHLVQAAGGAALGWAPDGRLVYGLAEWPPSEPATTLWSLAVDPSTGEPTAEPLRIGSWSSSVEGTLTVSRSGQLAFPRYIGQLDVYLTELIDGGKRMSAPRRLTMTELDERPTDWSEDGAHIIFMSNQNGGQHAFRQDLNSSTAEMLTTGPAWYTWPRLAPNGALLFWYLPADANPSRAQLMRMEQSGSAPIQVLTAGESVLQQRIGKPPPHNAQFRCARLADTCVLGELNAGELRFSSIDPAHGRTKELARTDVDRMPRYVEWDLSPDGRTVVLPRSDGSIRLLDLAEASQKDRMVMSHCHFQFAAWSADGQGVFLSGRCRGTKMYTLLFAELGGPVHVLHESANEWLGNPVPSPDGRRLAFSLKPQRVDVWLLQAF
jgi:serine/threonine protein kinase